MKPAVSILMSVHNQVEYLDEALESILNQTLKSLEYIIINDKSNSQTLEHLEQYKDNRITLIHNRKRQGLARSLNLGLKLCSGKYIARMDADDIALPSRIKKQYDFLESHPHLAGCGTWVTLINEQGKKIGSKHYPQAYPHIKKIIMRYSPFVHPSVMIRRNILETINGYDVNLNGAEDYDLWLRIVSQYQMVNVPLELLKYRINARGVSWGKLKHLELQALQARVKAIRHYDYPIWQIVYLIKPLLSFLIPTRIKKNIFSIE